MCGKWNAMPMDMADGKAVMCISWMLHRTCLIMQQKFYYIVPNSYYVQHIMNAPTSPTQHQVLPYPLMINWTPTTTLIPCQVQLGPAYEPWCLFSEEKLQEQSTRQRLLRNLFWNVSLESLFSLFSVTKGLFCLISTVLSLPASNQLSECEVAYTYDIAVLMTGIGCAGLLWLVFAWVMS